MERLLKRPMKNKVGGFPKVFSMADSGSNAWMEEVNQDLD